MKTKKNEEKNNLNRRDLLKYSGSGALALMSSNLMIGDTFARSAIPGSNENVITIFLRGGHDALSMCAPLRGTARKNYDKKRPNISYGMKSIGDSFFGLNSEVSGSVLDLFHSKDMAIVHGVGGLNETTSHFAQMDYIESGHSRELTPKGFLGRFCEIANLSNMFALESKVPRSLRSDQYVMQFTDKWSLGNIQRTRRQQVGITKSEFLRSFFGKGTKRKVSSIANQHADRSEQVFSSIRKLNQRAKYQNKNLGLLSEMISGGNNGIYTISVGGWDHHRDLKSQFVSLVDKLFDDLLLLTNDLKASGQWNNTTIIVHSEFGRRVGENGSLGCDHGRGGIAYVLGGKVKGGKVYKKRSYVDDLKSKLAATETNPRSNLGVFYDVRNLYAEVFKMRFRLSNDALKAVFGNDANFKFGKSDRIPFLS